MTSIFSPIKVGSIEANNRVFMAPLTRARATKEGVPTELMATYYSQRASAGLIVSEATSVNRAGLGWPYAPGIWSDEQVEKWKLVTEAVHAKGGKILSQLWHMGRASHSNVSGTAPVSSSATTFPDQVYTYDGKLDPEVAHALTIEEIKETIKEYVVAAKNSVQAGFDGVQIHAANGYLIEQFLKDSTNHRTDAYGGSIENRVRFLKEVVEEVAAAIGAEKVNVRFSPNGDTFGAIDSNPEPLYAYAAQVLQKLGIASIELRENSINGTFGGPTDQPQLHGVIRKAFHGVLILNQDYTREEAIEAVRNGTADAISFGRKYIANPNLVEKLEQNKPLLECNDLVKWWWYSQGPEGYTDFPAN